MPDGEPRGEVIAGWIGQSEAGDGSHGSALVPRGTEVGSHEIPWHNELLYSTRADPLSNRRCDQERPPTRDPPATCAVHPKTKQE